MLLDLMRRCFFCQLVAGVLALAISICSVRAQDAKEKETKTIALIQKAAGVVTRNADGEVEAVSFSTSVGVDLDSLDLGVFPKTTSLSVLNHKQILPFPWKAANNLPPNLKFLSLVKVELGSKEVVPFLKKQKSLSMLWIRNCKLDDNVVDQIALLQNLHSVSLSKSMITDRHAKKLSRLCQLYCLDLSDTPVTDDSLPHLAKIDNLGILDLSGTKVTDAGLAHLARLPFFQQLKVSNTKVTKVGAQRLGEASPMLKVIHD